MKKHPLFCIVIALFVGPALAEPASNASIERLLGIMKTESTMDAMYSGVEQMMRQTMQQVTAGQNVTPEQQRIMDSVPPRFVAVMRSELTWEKLRPQYVQLYRETFSQEEIDGLVTFYESAPGQAYIGKMPTLLQKSLAMSQTQIQGLMPKMKAAIEQAVQDAKLGR